MSILAPFNRVGKPQSIWLILELFLPKIIFILGDNYSSRTETISSDSIAIIPQYENNIRRSSSVFFPHQFLHAHAMHTGPKLYKISLCRAY